MRMFRIGSVRDKCPLAVEMLSLAIQRARALCGAVCYNLYFTSSRAQPSFVLLCFALWPMPCNVLSTTTPLPLDVLESSTYPSDQSRCCCFFRLSYSCVNICFFEAAASCCLGLIRFALAGSDPFMGLTGYWCCSHFLTCFVLLNRFLGFRYRLCGDVVVYLSN